MYYEKFDTPISIADHYGNIIVRCNVHTRGMLSYKAHKAVCRTFKYLYYAHKNDMPGDVSDYMIQTPTTSTSLEYYI